MIKKQLLKSNFVSSSASILDVIKSLNKSKEKICIVLNSKKRVCGLITDGDLRRIILKEKDFKNRITKFFKKKYVFLRENTNKLDAKKIFLKKKDIHFIPVLRRNGSPLGLYTRKNVLNQNEFENEVFILAGGLGKRLYTLTDFIPKPMLNVGARPLL